MSAQPVASRTAEWVLDREYLEIRAKLLELAAFFDRLDRGGGAPQDDPRCGQLRRAMELIGEEEGDRAERLLLHFSRSYEADWRDRFPMTRH